MRISQLVRRVMPFASVLAAIAWPAAAQAVYVFTSITPPGSTDTQVFGINDNGQIAVSTDSGSTIYSHGLYTPIANAPGWDYTGASSINNAQVVVGVVSNSTGTQSDGFILNHGTFTFASYPGAQETSFRTIGNGGLVTGNAMLTSPTSSTTIAFVYDPATQTFTNLPFANSYLTILGNVNTAGQSVGTTYLQNGSPYSFLRQADGSILPIGDQNLRARSINDQGVITGWIQGTNGILDGFVGTSAGMQTIDIPASLTGFASVSTIPEAINNAGQISGYWTNADYTFEGGFIASPATLPVGTTANGAYVFDTAVIPNVPIFIDPAVATGYDYATGTGDPLFASVTLPIGIGDDLYTIIVDGLDFAATGGTLFDFRANGFADGVDRFRVVGIETDAALDPLNPGAFVTELTFVGAGFFTGTQTPIVTVLATVPEPVEWALFGIAAPLAAWVGRRRRVRPPSVAPASR